MKKDGWQAIKEKGTDRWRVCLLRNGEAVYTIMMDYGNEDEAKKVAEERRRIFAAQHSRGSLYLS